MSKFSGKCDFYDSVVAIHCDGDINKLEKYLGNTDIYILGLDDRYHKVKCETEKDAVKYYPYIIGIMVHNGEEGRNKIILSSDSFIDKEEKEWLEWKIEDVFKYWRKCKRKKELFTAEKFLNQDCFGYGETMEKVANRIAEYGKKADFKDIHDSTHEYFRKIWYEEMIRVGYAPHKAFDWIYKDIFASRDTIELRLGKEVADEIFGGKTE